MYILRLDDGMAFNTRRHTQIILIISDSFHFSIRIPPCAFYLQGIHQAAEILRRLIIRQPPQKCFYRNIAI